MIFSSNLNFSKTWPLLPQCEKNLIQKSIFVLIAIFLSLSPNWALACGDLGKHNSPALADIPFGKYFIDLSALGKYEDIMAALEAGANLNAHFAHYKGYLNIREGPLPEAIIHNSDPRVAVALYKAGASTVIQPCTPLLVIPAMDEKRNLAYFEQLFELGPILFADGEGRIDYNGLDSVIYWAAHSNPYPEIVEYLIKKNKKKLGTYFPEKLEEAFLEAISENKNPLIAQAFLNEKVQADTNRMGPRLTAIYSHNEAMAHFFTLWESHILTQAQLTEPASLDELKTIMRKGDSTLIKLSLRYPSIKKMFAENYEILIKAAATNSNPEALACLTISEPNNVEILLTAASYNNNPEIVANLINMAEGKVEALDLWLAAAINLNPEILKTVASILPMEKIPVEDLWSIAFHGNPNPDIMEQLLKLTGDPRLAIKNDQAIYNLVNAAARKPHPDLALKFLQYLSDNEAREDGNDYSGHLYLDNRLLLYFVAEGLDPELIKFLINSGRYLDINYCESDWGNARCSTPLLLAFNSDSPKRQKIIELLLKNKANINQIDMQGNNALMLAAANKGTSGEVEMLISAGLEVNLLNDADETALDLAYANYNLNMVELLEKHGAIRSRIDDLSIALYSLADAWDYYQKKNGPSALPKNIEALFSFGFSLKAYDPETEKFLNQLIIGINRNSELKNCRAWAANSEGQFIRVLNADDKKVRKPNALELRVISRQIKEAYN